MVEASRKALGRTDMPPQSRERSQDSHRAWLESPRQDKLSERLARRILSDIVRGQLPAGAMLPSEAAMIESYGVGRNSLREALRILEIHGLIKIKPGPRGGPVVASVSSSDLARSASFYFNAMGATFGDLLRARLVIEPIMVRLAAMNMTPESAEAITNALERHDEAGPNAEDWMPQSADFHVIVNSLSGNPVLDLVFRALIDIYVERTPSSYPSDDSEGVRRAHGRIAKAIIAGDADLAESRMRRHIENQLTTVRRHQPELMNEPIDWR
jgi:DNA-binding FadR family transcriptional regulator